MSTIFMFVIALALLPVAFLVGLTLIRIAFRVVILVLYILGGFFEGLFSKPDPTIHDGEFDVLDHDPKEGDRE